MVEYKKLNKRERILDIVAIYKNKLLYIWSISGLIIFFVLSSEARWEILKTPNFTCFYPEGYQWEAQQALSNLEHYKDDVVELTGNKKIGNLPVVIEDIGGVSGGFASPLFKQINIFTYPPSPAEDLSSSQNWYRLVGIHEYTHIAHLTKVSGLPEMLSSIYGSMFLPNLYSPYWIIEGITTFSESQPSIYEGGLNDGIFDAIIKSKAAGGKFPSIVEATYLPLEFPGCIGMYIYGGKFFEFLSNKYGKEKFAQFFETYGSSVLSYLSPVLPAISLDKAAKKVFGKSFPELFSEWKKEALEQYSSDFYIDGEQLTKEETWLITSLLLSDNKLYYIRYYPRKTGAFSVFYFAEIVERDVTTQKERVVTSSTSGFIARLKKLEDNLYYAVYEIKPGYSNSTLLGFGYLVRFYEKNLRTNKERLLFEDELRSFDIFEDKRIIYAKDKKHSFGSELWMWESTDKKRKIMDLDILICGLNILSDKKIIVEARHDWQNSDIYLLDITTCKIKPLIQTPFIETNISVTNKQILFFCANYNKEIGIYAYNLETKKLSKLTYGGFSAFPVFDEKTNQLYFVGLTALGTKVYKKKIEKFTDFKLPDYPQSLPPSFKTIRIQKGNKLDYLKTLIPKIHIPYLTKEGGGIILVGQDAIGENMYQLNILAEEKNSLFLNYKCLRFKPSVLSINYDLGEEVSFHVNYPLRYKIASPLSIGVGFGYREFDKFKRNSFNPSFTLSFNYPKTFVGFVFDYSLERKQLGSTKNKDTIYASSSLTQYIKNSKFDLKTLSIHTTDKTQFKIRGYKDTLEGRDIFSASLGYSQPILKLRKGLWNPNIFLEDLCLVIFTDTAFGQNNKTQLSVGIELQQEMSTFFGILNFIPHIGITLNKEGKITTYFSLYFSL